MSTNILKAVSNLVRLNRNDLMQIYKGSNRINNMGTALEYYLTDIFCDSLDKSSIAEKEKTYSQYLCYIGNQNNPPDFIISGGDAVEVKKIEGIRSGIALNSSYPKAKLYADSDMITEACKNCEKWDIKDIVYSVGTVDPENKDRLKLLWMVYGDCYAASKEVYEKLRSKIAKGLNEMPGVDFSETNELGRVNKVDPLGITYMRIRGMWGIENPIKVFDYIAKFNDAKDFTLFVLMRAEKYNSFPKADRDAIEKIKSSVFSIADVEIKNPDNPAKFIPAKLIKFVIG